MGKKMKKSLGLTALVVAVSLCLSACGGPSSSAGGGGGFHKSHLSED